uniref:F-box domain-containing protein n=1 Tax=Nelumbo nucifera TaxID=4432 RepID=A0A822XNG0_NELNU|nr:TPA_asm: hypothetical protein HUJ06_022706 [Nelumbo nucifera]
MSLRKALLFGRSRTKRCFNLSNLIQEPGTLKQEETEADKQQADGHGEADEEIKRVSDEDGWSDLLPELLVEIIQRVESSEDRWPSRKNVVACASVCKRWREVTKGTVRSPLQCGKITFPSSLKQVCFVLFLIFYSIGSDGVWAFRSMSLGICVCNIIQFVYVLFFLFGLILFLVLLMVQLVFYVSCFC